MKLGLVYSGFDPAPLYAYLFEICVDYVIPEFSIVLQFLYAFKIHVFVPQSQCVFVSEPCVGRRV